MKFNAIILAAGKGARMKSKTPKVLHNISGKPMVSYVVETARKIGAEQIVVVVGADFPDLTPILGSDLDYVVK
ncbi:MAG: NTP transferase domain-containing protein, partial [Clostridiales bacterium]|nr:NTP transferase domain-containing protein [Clostridiales bacterium]